MSRRHIWVIAALFGIISGTAVLAQQEAVPLNVESPILTIDSDRMFEQSEFGRGVIMDIEARGAGLAAENRKIEEALVAEERRLTDLRPTMSAADFRELADAFDEKVQQTRRAQDAKTRDLNVELDEQRVVFLNAAAPVLEQLMREAGAAVVLERRSVFISSNAVDITRVAVQRLNLVLTAEDVTVKP